MTPALLVLRSPDIDRLAAFYAACGAAFVRERHGSGPEHFAATLPGGFVLELYPADVADSVRLGFRVDDLDAVLRSLASTAVPRDSPWGRSVVVRDPDGRAVELYEAARR